MTMIARLLERIAVVSLAGDASSDATAGSAGSFSRDGAETGRGVLVVPESNSSVCKTIGVCVFVTILGFFEEDPGSIQEGRRSWCQYIDLPGWALPRWPDRYLLAILSIGGLIIRCSVLLDAAGRGRVGGSYLAH